MMRKKIILATLLVLLVAIYLHLYLKGKPFTSPQKNYSVQKDTKYHMKKVFRYNNGKRPNSLLYVMLLNELRIRLTGTTDANGIALTRPVRSINDNDRFIEVRLENGVGDVIFVLIDTSNVFVVGYLVGEPNSRTRQTLYFLDGTPDVLMRQYTGLAYNREPLRFDGNYNHLPRGVAIGHRALNTAITTLQNNIFQEGRNQIAIVVIIQMVPEAVRFRYFQHLIVDNMMGEIHHNFAPNQRARSMVLVWSDLSDEVQCAGTDGAFDSDIQIVTGPSAVDTIDNVATLLRRAPLALMLSTSDRGFAISMPGPGPVAGVGECGEPTINIIGRDGQCMDVKKNEYNDGNNIILWACGDGQANQLWTIKSDGTIRSNGKCLVTFGYTPGNYLMIYDCDTAAREATQWIFHNAGTIMNPETGLVITAETSTQGTLLKVAQDHNSSRQAWRAGNYTQPTISYIIGFRELCLHADIVSDGFLWLTTCVIDTEPRQQWALYCDNTIRPYSDRTLCVTSDGQERYDSIRLNKCKGSGNQRWTFNADGTILNPDARLVMDVQNSHYYVQLNEPAGSPNQNWLAF